MDEDKRLACAAALVAHRWLGRCVTHTIATSQPPIRPATSFGGTSDIEEKLDLSEHSDSGTSLAAPIVSFTAGLIRQFGITSPRAIKQRIIASADVKPELGALVWSSGVLNPAKALELYHDYFEIDGQAAPLRGAVLWNPFDSWMCDGQPLADLRQVLKIAKVGPANSTNYLVMWRAPDGSLQKCNADLSGESIDFVEEGKAQRQLLLGPVREFVARSF